MELLSAELLSVPVLSAGGIDGRRYCRCRYCRLYIVAGHIDVPVLMQFPFAAFGLI